MKDRKEYQREYQKKRRIKNRESINSRTRQLYSEHKKNLAAIRLKRFIEKHGKVVYKRYKRDYVTWKTKYPESYKKMIEYNRVKRRKKFKEDILYRERELRRLKSYAIARAHNSRSDIYKLTSKMVRDLYKKFDHKCNYCGALSDLSVDHILSIKMGGTNALENLQILCMPCNRKKSWK